MQYISNINYPVLVFLSGLLVLDASTKISKGCTNFTGVALGLIVGAVLGGFLFNLLGISAGGLIGSLVTATVGAIALLFLVSLIKK